MKPFNLEEALAGKPCKTRNGCEAHVTHQGNKKFGDTNLTDI